jgi:hypothetical protein
MKNLLAQIVCVLALSGIACGGTDFNRLDSKTPETAPGQSWHASGEFNFQLFGVYALTQDTYRLDRYLHSDRAWGGSIDAKYFLNRYFAVGLEGYAVSATQTHTSSQCSVHSPPTRPTVTNESLEPASPP